MNFISTFVDNLLSSSDRPQKNFGISILKQFIFNLIGTWFRAVPFWRKRHVGISDRSRLLKIETACSPAKLETQPVSNVCQQSQFDSSKASTEALDRTVSIVAMCNVFTVLERQLADINKDVENSVAGVCKGFKGMAEHAQAAVVAATQSCSTEENDGNGNELIADMQNVLIALVENARSSSEFTQSICEKLGLLEKRLVSIEKAMNEVEELACQAKLVALNGQIEAARLGPAGKPFEVVARETKKLSNHAATTSDSIKNLVADLSKQVRDTSTDITQKTEIDNKTFLQSQTRAKELLSNIEREHIRITNSLATTSELSSFLQRDISNAVLSMQFQDRVSQRVSHVISTMELLADDVDPQAKQLLASEAKNRSDKWLSQIAKTYTMDSERQVINNENMLANGTVASDELFDVELF